MKLGFSREDVNLSTSLLSQVRRRQRRGYLVCLAVALLAVAGMLGCGGDAGVTIGLPDGSPPLVDAGGPPDAGPDSDVEPAATPAFDPAPGTFAAPQSITIRTSTPGATIYYTLDGQTPDVTSPIYTSPIQVGTTTTINAIAVKAGFGRSAVQEGLYVIAIPPGTVESVAFDPIPKDYPNDVDVSLTSKTAGANVCYTLDGSQPSCDAQARCAGGSIAYASSVHVSKSGQRIEAMACKDGMIASLVTTADYTLTAAAPTFDPAPGKYDPHNPGPITVSTATQGGVIHYTINGTTPPTCSTPDTIPATGTLPAFTGDAVVRALTCKDNYAASAVVTATYLGTMCTGDFYVKSRADLEALARCDVITGLLEIYGSTDITDLAPLGHLQRVGGTLIVESNGALTSLHGLEALTATGGGLWLRDNAVLARIDGLVALQTVGGSLLVRGNAITEWLGPSTLTKVGYLVIGEKKLTHVGGFSQLAAIAGDLLVKGNDSLTAFDDMPALASIDGQVAFSSNGALASLPRFTAVRQLGWLSIDSNAALTTVAAFPQITTTDLVHITANPKLAQLDLKSFSVLGDLYLGDGLPALASLQGLSGVTSTRNLTISGEVGFASLAGLEQITTVNGTLSVASTKGLVNLAGLTNVTSVAQTVSIWGNQNLTSLHSLDKVQIVGTPYPDIIDISQNPAMTEIDGLNAVGLFTTYIYIQSNPKLARLNALHGIKSTQYIRLMDDVALKQLDGFEALTEITGILSITGCSALTDLTGLEALQKMGGSLTIDTNASLTSLDALAQFVSFGNPQNNSVLTITNNATLPMCQANRVLARLQAHGYGGPSDIRNNRGTGTCN